MLVNFNFQIAFVDGDKLAQKKKAAMTPRLTNDNPDEEGEEDGYNKDEGRLK